MPFFITGGHCVEMPFRLQQCHWLRYHVVVYQYWQEDRLKRMERVPRSNDAFMHAAGHPFISMTVAPARLRLIEQLGEILRQFKRYNKRQPRTQKLFSVSAKQDHWNRFHQLK